MIDELEIDFELLERIALNAANQCYGIVDLSGPDGVTLSTFVLPRFLKHKGVEVSKTNAGYVVDIYVICAYGTSIKVICKNLIDNIKYMASQYEDVKLKSIRVHVKGIHRG